MQSIIDVFRMTEVSPRTRASIIIMLGRIINDQNGMNLTEPLVYELVQLLDPGHAILEKPHHKKMWEEAQK